MQAQCVKRKSHYLLWALAWTIPLPLSSRLPVSDWTLSDPLSPQRQPGFPTVHFNLILFQLHLISCQIMS